MENNNQYQVYPYRWIILIMFMLIAMSVQLSWLTFAPVAQDASIFFFGDASEDNLFKIDLLAMVFMLIYLPMSFPASWCIDKFGLKWGTGIGVIFIGVSSLLRIFNPVYSWMLVCQILCSIGQPFILNSFTKVAANWFPQKEEALAMGLGTMSMFLGLLTAMFATDFIMAHYKEVADIETGMLVILRVYGIVPFAAMVLYLLLVKDKPPVAPNPIAAEVKLAVFEGVKDLVKNRGYIFLTIAFFIGLGAFNTIFTLIDKIFDAEAKNMFMPLQDKIDPDVTTGLIGGLIIAGGIIGAVVMSAISDKLNKRKIFLIMSMGMSVPLLILMQFVPARFLIAIFAFIFGFFLIAAMPVGLSYATENTHPVPEGTSNGILMLAGQIGGIILVFACELEKFLFSGFSMVLMACLFTIGFFLALKLPETKRT